MESTDLLFFLFSFLLWIFFLPACRCMHHRLSRLFTKNGSESVFMMVDHVIFNKRLATKLVHTLGYFIPCCKT